MKLQKLLSLTFVEPRMSGLKSYLKCSKVEVDLKTKSDAPVVIVAGIWGIHLVIHFAVRVAFTVAAAPTVFE